LGLATSLRQSAGSTVPLTLGNTIVAGNSSRDANAMVTSLGYNLIGNGSQSSGYVDTDLVGTSDNPIDPLLGPLQNNGGPTTRVHCDIPGPAAETDLPGQIICSLGRSYPAPDGTLDLAAKGIAQ
jgi:hypothetical protein